MMLRISQKGVQMQEEEIMNSGSMAGSGLFSRKGCLLVVGLGVVLFAVTAQASDRYWIATNAATWNNTANWSTNTGGSAGASVPGSLDTAIFDSNGLGNCSLDMAPTVAGFTNGGGYTATFATSNNNLTVNKNFAWKNGTINAGASAMYLGISTAASTIDFSGGTLNAGTSKIVFYCTDMPANSKKFIPGSSSFYDIELN